MWPERAVSGTKQHLFIYLLFKMVLPLLGHAGDISVSEKSLSTFVFKLGIDCGSKSERSKSFLLDWF